MRMNFWRVMGRAVFGLTIMSLPIAWAVEQGPEPVEPMSKVSKRRIVPQQTADTRPRVESVQQIQQPRQKQRIVRDPIPQQVQQQTLVEPMLVEPPVEQSQQDQQLEPGPKEAPAQNGAEGTNVVLPVSLPAKPCVNRPGQAPDMVLIEAGRFLMGSPDGNPDEGPQHGVAVVKPFAMSRCEVTRGEFAAFVAGTGYVTDAEKGKGCYVLNVARDDIEQKNGTSWRNPEFAQTDQHPVVCISWRDAQAYIAWLSARAAQGYRLPTEAEWEYAARAGTRTSRFWGDDPNTACDYANGADQSLETTLPEWAFPTAACNDRHAFTAPAGSYQRNLFGLSDMLGNAWEWVQDCWYDNYDSAPADGSARGANDKGECSRVVLRGGGWYNEPEYLRSANRYRNYPDVANDFVGFRLARTL